MKLLLDQNLSPRLIASLAELYPGSAHVKELKVIWIRLGNCTTSEVLEVLTERRQEVLGFGDRPAEAFLVLGR